jgi:hypothetical protein
MIRPLSPQKIIDKQITSRVVGMIEVMYNVGESEVACYRALISSFCTGIRMDRINHFYIRDQHEDADNSFLKSCFFTDGKVLP